MPESRSRAARAREAAKPTLAEVAARAEQNASLDLDNAELLTLIDEGRERR